VPFSTKDGFAALSKAGPCRILKAGTSTGDRDYAAERRAQRVIPAGADVSTKKAKSEDSQPYVQIFRKNPQAMWVYDRESLRFLDVNQAAVDLYGYSRAKFLSMHADDLELGNEPCVPSQPQTKEIAPPILECRHRSGSGVPIEVEITTQEIVYAGHPAVLAVVVDAARRKQLEAQLLQAQKMEAVGMLAGGIAHDFNNLLTVIAGYSQLLLNSLSPSDRNRTSVEQIMKAGDRAAALTRQLLAFSRRQAMQTRVLDLNVLVGKLAVMLQRLIGEDIDLRLDFSRDLGQVNADPGQIEQVIMNLVVNSRDAMPQGGTLTLQTANVELTEDYTATQTRVKAGSYVMLQVRDSGSGMDPATRSRLFEPFFTTKAQGRGTGLGLSIVFGIVRQSGGNLEIQSEPGRGTSVKIYLPRVEQPAVAETESPAVEAERGSETILLVEDEEALRKMVRETLEREGYRVLEAGGPGQAEQICRTYKDAIDLMITDVVMPKENGRALAARVTKVRPDMKVLFMSGYAESTTLNGEIPQSRFMQKPFTPAALARKVRSVLKPRNSDKCHGAGG
jgi:PAS domain S-box-containing protein